ncbi:hypothetical protein HU200_031711 [Digitaria exilis]|uniref:Uncharacterized protein n=1 Tax=Digitaria exilis TaxID=1010633 RepID=A0A835C132_9POAL|nr:hypothetical protein HU200_031711 [Digitaria exilis]
MAPKRKKSHVDGEVESEDGSAANPGDMSTFDFAKPVYLVAEHEGGKTAYSVFKVDAGGGGGGTKPLRVHTVAGLPNTTRGMSFVTAHSKLGSWIVGVGGKSRAGTIILDPSTLETYQGPRFLHPRSNPVLISLAGEVYVLSRRPRVVPGIDFEPWFYSLSFKEEIPIGGGVGCTFWCKLPPPPFFPWSLNPYQFCNPPEVVVTSYAAVGSSHILLSGVSTQQAHQEEPIILGTYAFHVVNKTWEKVHSENLPFVGQAVPLGCGSLFVACPVSKNNGVTTASASLFHISIMATSSIPMSPPSLLIQEFPVLSPSLSFQEFPVRASEGEIPKPLFCPLGNGSFCSIMSGSSLQSCGKPNCPEKDQVILTAFQIENIDAILNACQSVGKDAKTLQVAVQVKEQEHTCKFKGRSHVVDSDMPVVAALSM